MNPKKICLVGPSKVGKSTFVNMHLGDRFSDTFRPTIGVEVHPMIINGHYFNIWDISGDPKYKGLLDDYLLGVDGFIVFVDRFDIDTACRYAQSCKLSAPNKPIIICFAKCDLLSERELKLGKESIKELGYPRVILSSKTKTKLKVPFEKLICEFAHRN